MLSNVLTFDKVYCASEFKCMNHKSISCCFNVFKVWGFVKHTESIEYVVHNLNKIT